MRTHRPDVPILYSEDDEFPFGGFKQLAQGNDLLIVASGYMVHVANEALPTLKKAGISPTLIDVYSIPLQTDKILELAQQSGGKILVVEDNYVGGFADEITAAASATDAAITVQSLYVQRVPKSTKSPTETLQMVRLTVEDIAAAAKKL